MALPAVTGEFRLATEPDLHFAPTGTAVLRLRLVASSRKRQPDGSWADDLTAWVSATAFGNLAEHGAESLSKGDLVTVTGRLVTDEWETADGQKRSENRILVDTLGVSLAFRTTPHGGRVSHAAASSPAPAQGHPEGGSSPQRGVQRPERDPWASDAGSIPF
jgi:single-strand DNA-binding protein